jgi:hypothetical protein
MTITHSGDGYEKEILVLLQKTVDYVRLYFIEDFK